jgi:hypothetical protein
VSRAAPRNRRIPPSLLTELALIFPLLVIYELGAAVSDLRNGVDFLTGPLVRLVGFAWFEVGLIVSFIALLAFLRSRGQSIDARRVLPVLLESAIFALSMGTFIVFVMVDLLHIDPRLALPRLATAKMGIGDEILMSIGAGVHEELMFRLLLCGGGAWVLSRLTDLSPWKIAVITILVSSVLFSAAHHIGPYGDPLALGVFTYRFLAGIFFALLFHFRGLAVAVYTHALYDIHVMVLQ